LSILFDMASVLSQTISLSHSGPTGPSSK
jgi:hypothetical protein